MSALTLLKKKNISGGFQPLAHQPTDFFDVVSAEFDNVRDNFNIDSQARLVGEEREKRYSNFKELTGLDLRDEARKRAMRRPRS